MIVYLQMIETNEDKSKFEEIYQEYRNLWSNISCTEIVTGQVLQFRNGSSGPYAHSVYVSGGTNDSYANIKVNQHTENAQRTLDEVIRGFGSNSCYMRQLVFKTANFDS